MGSPIATTVAEIVLQHLENIHIKQLAAFDLHLVSKWCSVMYV